MAGSLGRASFVPWCGPHPDVQHLATGNQQLTTVLVRNVPHGVAREEVLLAVNTRGFEGAYDLLYLPMDFRTHENKGYCFLNLVSEELARSFMGAFNGFSEWPMRSRRVCTVEWSVTQGFNLIADLCRNSRILGDHVPDKFKPVVFVGKTRVSFPEPA